MSLSQAGNLSSRKHPARDLFPLRTQAGLPDLSDRAVFSSQTREAPTETITIYTVRRTKEHFLWIFNHEAE